jgi:hypothetical protein
MYYIYVPLFINKDQDLITIYCYCSHLQLQHVISALITEKTEGREQSPV